MSWKLFDPQTPILIQGMTGKEGMRMATWLIQSGVNVAAGVTPGKAGQTIEDRPIFNSVADARSAIPEIETSCIAVPSTRVLAAVQEATEAGIRFMHILTERVPVHDVIAMQKLVKNRATILGPSSVGYLQFPRFRLGYIGGENPFSVLSPGGASIISTSGGMTNELMMACARLGIGIHTAMAVGGDRIPCLSLAEAIQWADALSETKMLLVFAEPSHPFLTSLVHDEYLPQKPLILFLAGDILDTLPRGVAYGHTGTILGENDLSVHEFRTRLQERGIICVKTMKEFENCISNVVPSKTK